MQRELPFWPPSCVRRVLLDYLDMRCPGIVDETRIDYETRVEWLCEVLGPTTPADHVTFTVLEKVTRDALVVLAPRTVKMRLQFWAGAVEYAELREVVTRGRPRLPPWLKGATKPMDDYYTVLQFAQFRLGLPDDKVRRFADLAFWTGMHTKDIEQTERWMLQPDHEWGPGLQCGRWWRRNTKSVKKIEPAWIPMEPELHSLAVGWLSMRGDPEKRICGAVHNKRKWFDLAAARAELEAVRPNLGLRSSHASMLLARGYSFEYVRQVLGHRGEIRGQDRPDAPGPNGGPRPARAVTTRPSILTGHYARPSPETLRPRG